LLIQGGADVNLQDVNGHTALIQGINLKHIFWNFKFNFSLIQKSNTE
jgi:ankyrin repeat protein